MQNSFIHSNGLAHIFNCFLHNTRAPAPCTSQPPTSKKSVINTSTWASGEGGMRDKIFKSLAAVTTLAPVTPRLSYKCTSSCSIWVGSAEVVGMWIVERN